MTGVGPRRYLGPRVRHGAHNEEPEHETGTDVLILRPVLVASPLHAQERTERAAGTAVITVEETGNARRTESRVAIRLFTGKRFKGREHRVAKSHGDLKVTSVDYGTKSMILESRSDRALLFSKTGYKGKVELVVGPRRIPDLADAAFSKLRAIRIAPFRLDLNITVVHKGDNLPGRWTSRAQVQNDLDDVVGVANRIWDQGMLQFRRKGRFHFRESLGKFDLTPPFPTIPSSWKRKGLVDVVVVNRIGKRGIAGKGMPPMIGNTVMLPRRVGMRKMVPDLTVNQMAYAFAHEIGHYLGIHHGSAKGRQSNLMFKEMPARVVPGNVQLRSDQVEEVHRTLARNISRNPDRH